MSSIELKPQINPADECDSPDRCRVAAGDPGWLVLLEWGLRVASPVVALVFESAELAAGLGLVGTVGLAVATYRVRRRQAG